MGKEHEHGCAECFKGYLLEKGHVVCYEPGPDAPDYIFTVDGEKYSVEVTEIKADPFFYLPEEERGFRICERIKENVQQIRKNSKREPQTGFYLLDIILPLPLYPERKLEVEINRIAGAIANAEFPSQAVENKDPPDFPWQVRCADYANTLIIQATEAPSGLGKKEKKQKDKWEYSRMGEICDGDKGQWGKMAKHLVVRLREKNKKIENNELDKPKVLLLFGIADVPITVAGAWSQKLPELENAAKNFDCILLMRQENGQYKCHELISFSRRS